MPEFDYKKWHFGFTLGPESQNVRIDNNSNDITPYLSSDRIPEAYDPKGDNTDSQYSTVDKSFFYSDIPTLSTGFHVGIITSRRINEFLNIRLIPSLSLGQKNITSRQYQEDAIIKDGAIEKYYFFKSEEELIITKIKSTYISLPILLKYKAVRIENFRPYMVAGTNIKFDLSTDLDNQISLKKLDTTLEFGLGSDFYLETFRLGIELRFGLGLFNMLQTNRPDDKNPYLTNSMSNIRAKTFTLAINFE